MTEIVDVDLPPRTFEVGITAGTVGPPGRDGEPGPRGLPGSSTVIVMEFETRTPDELPPSGLIPAGWDSPGNPAVDLQLIVGWSMVYKPTGNIFVFVGVGNLPAGWIEVEGGVRGPPGPDGPVGPPGAQGDRGPDRRPRRPGLGRRRGPARDHPDPKVRSARSATAARKASKAHRAPTATPGPPGPPGRSGPAGADSTVPGPPGADGADGLDGAEGPPGPQGDVGFQGAQGVAGPPGVDGQQGPSVLIRYMTARNQADLPLDGVIPPNFDATGVPSVPVVIERGQGVIDVSNQPGRAFHVYVFVRRRDAATGVVGHRALHRRRRAVGTDRAARSDGTGWGGGRRLARVRRPRRRDTAGAHRGSAQRSALLGPRLRTRRRRHGRAQVLRRRGQRSTRRQRALA